MVELSDAALRHNLVQELLKEATEPLSMNDLYSNPKLRAHCKAIYNVGDSLNHLYQKKIVRKVPIFGQQSKIGYELGMPSGENIPKKSTKPQISAQVVKKSTPKVNKVKALPEVVPNEPSFDINLLPMMAILLSKDELQGFLKGALIVFPNQRNELLAMLKESNSNILNFDSMPRFNQTAP